MASVDRPGRALDVACAADLALAFLLAAGFWALGRTGVISRAEPGYMELLFDDTRVHQIDIEVDDWNAFLADAPAERYVVADLTVDGERLEGVGLRAKGNNSLRLVEESGGVRYSLKVEFDHYRAGLTYHGLDKLSLDASYQDNSYLKNYMALRMMERMGVPAPASSFAWVTVNGEPWGLFLAIEEPEDAFAERVWGADHGMLYKPDYRSLSDENADVGLCYLGEDPALYDNIFRMARFEVTAADEERLIGALRGISEGGGALEGAVDTDEVLRYFAVQSFVVNLDGYLGRTGHNYFLYEEGGVVSMVPWDYNLAFGTYALGRPELPDDAGTYVNWPVDTPASREVMGRRPLYHNLMLDDGNFSRYHAYLEELAVGYVLSGECGRELRQAAELIAPYVRQDPTAFCDYGEFLVAVDTLEAFCELRAQSVQGQLEGSVPSTMAERDRAEVAGEHPYVDASSIRLEDMGELADLAPRPGLSDYSSRVSSSRAPSGSSTSAGTATSLYPRMPRSRTRIFVWGLPTDSTDATAGWLTPRRSATIC